MVVMLSKYIRRFIPLFLVLFFFALLFKLYEARIFNIAFADENTNFITGKWIAEGKIFYKDFFFNHQPIPSLISAAVQGFFDPNSIFLLVKRHREFLFFYSLAWIVFLTLRFGKLAVVIGTAVESTKFIFLGNVFLAEGLVVYPLIYLFWSAYRSCDKRIRIIRAELFLICTTFVYIFLNLLPLLPFLAVNYIAIALNKNSDRRFFIFSLALILLLAFAVLGLFVSWKGFFEQAFIVNLLEVAPDEASKGFGSAVFNTLLLPFRILFIQNSSINLLLKSISVAYICSLIMILKLRKYRLLFFSLIGVALINLRPIEFGIFSSGHRFLPFYSILITATVLNLASVIGQKRLSIEGRFSYFLLITVAVMVVRIAFSEFSGKVDQYSNWYKNYSVDFDYGETIKILSADDDKLMVAPQNDLIYWQSGLEPNSFYFFNLDFMFESKMLANDVYLRWRQNQPDFIYFEDNKKAFEFFDNLSGYQNVLQNGKPSRLYISQDKLVQIDNGLWEPAGRLGFTKPN
jgi:hypothetical protein